MGRLANLAAAGGQTLAGAAAALGRQPLLLTRIDQGLQPMPARLARALAELLGAELWEVQAACALNTDLDDGNLYNAIPPRLGEKVTATRLTPTLPVTVSQAPAPPPTTDRRLLVFFAKKVSGASVIEEYLLGADGTFGLVASATAAGAGYEEADAGFFYPDSSPIAVIAWDALEQRGMVVDPTDFSLSTAKTTSSSNYLPQILTVDVNGFIWLASQVDNAIYKLSPGDFTTVLATIDTSALGSARAIYSSPATGGLYALVTKAGGAPGTTDWKLVRYDPNTATLAKPATAYNSLTTDMAATNIVEASTVSGALFTAGSAGKLIEWDEGVGNIVPSNITLAGTPIPDRLRTLAYDADRDYFWAATETAVARLGTNGFANFVDVIVPADSGFLRGGVVPLVVPSLGFVLCPSSAANYTVRIYDAATAALRGVTGVGGGPNPVGTNNAPLSFALRPVV